MTFDPLLVLFCVIIHSTSSSLSCGWEKENVRVVATDANQWMP
jgi:hypothetical protein